MTAPTWPTDVWATALLAAAVLTPDAPELPADLRLWLDRDGDMWGEEPDGMVSPITGCLAWALPGSCARREFVEAEFGPLREVTP